jgi:hypothetical protein
LPTVIDSLLIELSLDPAKYTAGRKQVEQDLAKTKDSALRTAKDIEASGSKAASFFGKMRTEFLALTAALLSASALKKMVTDTTRTDDSVGRLSKTLNIAVEVMSRWQNANRLAGGTAEGMSSTISKMSDELETYKKTGAAPPMLAWLASLGVNIDQIKSVPELLDAINKAIQRFSMPERRAILEGIGITQDSLYLLIQNRDAFRSFLDEADKVGVITKRDADAARELSREFTYLAEVTENLGRALTTGLSGPLVKVLDLISKLIAGIKSLHDSELFSSGKMPWWAPSELWKSVPKNIEKSIDDGTKALDEMHGGLTPEQRESTIRSEFAKQGIDPDVAIQVARSEGGLDRFKYGDRGSSFGAFQLHKGGLAPGGNAVAGLGDEFQRQTGLDPANPANEAAAIRFAAEYVKTHGWGAFHGFHGVPTEGITGLSLGAPGAANAAMSHVDNSRRSTSTTDVSINGPINVNGVDTNSAPAVAAGLSKAIRNRALSNSAQSGAQ